MRKNQRLLLLFLLFSKRLLKRVSFWLLLGAAPLLVWGLEKLSTGESGVLHILLCQENREDPLSGEITGRLLSGKSVIQYELVERQEDACAMVESGQGDAAWIFPDGMQERLNRFTGGEYWEGGLLRVVEREDNVALRLAREKLFGALYSHASYSLYRSFVHDDLGLEADEETLLQGYESGAVEGSLFQHVYANGYGYPPDAAGQDYLVAPVRGMLALLVLLGSLTGTMYFLRDREQGVLDAVPYAGRERYLYLHQLTVTGIVAVAVLAALRLSGVFMGWRREAVWMTVYVVMCMCFCRLLRRLCGTLRRLAVTVPVLMLASFVLCPVFFPSGQWKALSYLLPPFYYLNGVYDGSYVFKMIFYCVFISAVDFAGAKILPEH